MCGTKEELDIEIAERMKTRIIKDIQYQLGTISYYTYSAMIIYDVWAEKQREEKEREAQGLTR